MPLCGHPHKMYYILWRQWSSLASKMASIHLQQCMYVWLYQCMYWTIWRLACGMYIARIYNYTYTSTANHAFSIHWPAPRLLRSLPPAVPTSTVKVYSVVGSRLSITTLESVVLIVLIAPATRPAWTEEGWYVTKYTGNPLAWWRVSGIQLTRAVLLLWILFTVTLLTWAVGAG